MDFIEVEVINWAKHQPRKDIKHPTWFALSNRILEDSKLFSLTDSEWKALLYVFCQASQQASSAVVRLDLAHARRVCEIQEKTLRSALDKLAYAGVTRTLRARDAHVTDTLRDTTLQDTTLHNTTEQVCTAVRERTSMPTSAEDLPGLLAEEVRALYPDPEFIPRESVKAWAWLSNNRQKSPKSVKGMRRFFASWLERGWERHRKSLPSSPAGTSDAEALARELAIIAQGAEEMGA